MCGSEKDCGFFRGGPCFFLRRIVGCSEKDCGFFRGGPCVVLRRIVGSLGVAHVWF